jgi:hypothetical protein
MSTTPHGSDRTHAHPYTTEELERLNFHNRYVGLYLWFGIIGMLAIPTIANVILLKQGYHRRKRAGFNVHTKRPPQMRMDRPEERQISVR